MTSTSSSVLKRRRQSKACGRCRRRKIRCDFQYPTCGACSGAKATCLGFDSIHGSDTPRSTVHHLEEQVASLELELAAVRNQAGNVLYTVDDAVEKLAMRVATAVAEPTGNIRKQEHLLPLVSNFFLSDSPLPPFDSQDWDGTKDSEPQPQSWRPVAISSIPRHVVDAMLNHYCKTYRPHYPSIDEEDLYRARDKLYDNPELAGYDAFVVYITLAISSNTLTHIDEKRAASTTSGLWVTAVAHLEQVGTTNSWERLQALQLLTHYGFLNPQHVNVCHCAAAATRLALQFGLHEELPLAKQIKLDAAVLNTRRRMFWNAYGMDAAAHCVRCQPFRWSRHEITAKFPDSESQVTPTHSAHMWSLREIECDITLGLYYPSLIPVPPNDNNISDAWRMSMQVRLEEWYQIIRQSVSLTEKIEFHELLFQIQVLRLNQSSPRRLIPSTEMRKRALKASTALIKEYSVLDRLGKMFMLWHAAHCVVEAGVYLLSSVLAGVELDSPDRQRVGGEDTSILTRYVKTFSSLIWKISRRWSSVAPHASALDAISTSISEILERWSDGQDVSNFDLASLKERLDKMTKFPLEPSQEYAPTNIPTNTTSVEPYPLIGRPQPLFDSTRDPVPTDEVGVSLNSGWLGNQAGLDPSFSIFPESYTLDYSDPMAWDFSGVDSEEIFAALLAGGQPEALLLPP